MIRNYGNYAVDNCRSAIVNPMGAEEYGAIEISRSRITDGIFIEWCGYSFSCAYGRKQIRLETIGQ